MESPHAATRQTAQTPLAANAAGPVDLIDASPVPLVAAASAGGEMRQSTAVIRRRSRARWVWPLLRHLERLDADMQRQRLGYERVGNTSAMLPARVHATGGEHAEGGGG